MCQVRRTLWRTSTPISRRSDPARLSDAADPPVRRFRRASAGWCNGNTPASGAGIRGSSPWPAASALLDPMTMDGKHDDGWKTAHMRGFSIHRCSGRPATLTRSVWGRCAYLSLGAAVGTIFLAGCGGSSSAPVTGASGASGASGISGSSQLSKGEFIKQADAVCAEANTAIADLSGGTTTGDEATQVSQELSIVRSELQSIQALQAPSEDQSTLKDFIAGLKNEVDALNKKNAAVAASQDTTTADSELESARTNAQQAASDYGMQDCGTGKARHTQPGASTAAPTTATTTAAPTP